MGRLLSKTNGLRAILRFFGIRHGFVKAEKGVHSSVGMTDLLRALEEKARKTNLIALKAVVETTRESVMSSCPQQAAKKSAELAARAVDLTRNMLCLAAAFVSARSGNGRALNAASAGSIRLGLQHTCREIGTILEELSRAAEVTLHSQAEPKAADHYSYARTDSLSCMKIELESLTALTREVLFETSAATDEQAGRDRLKNLSGNGGYAAGS